jgi:hypothetical protein
MREANSADCSETQHETGAQDSDLPAFLALVDSGTRNLLESMAAGNISADLDAPDHLNYSPPPHHLSPFEGWGLFEAHKDTKLTESLEKQGIALIAKSLLDRFDELSVGSADDEDERSVVNEDEVQEPTVAGNISFCLNFLFGS